MNFDNKIPVLGETEDLARFEHWQQIRKYAGYNLIENSSGEHKGKTKISKRKNNPLKKKQAVVAVIGKILSIICALVKKEENYDSSKVFNQSRQLEIMVALVYKK